MKLLSYFLILYVILSSCQREKLDEKLAQGRVEALLKDLADNDYNKLEKHLLRNSTKVNQWSKRLINTSN